MESSQLFGKVFQALNTHEVAYIIVGGVAVVLHGCARLTVDLDLVLRLDEDNARRAITALTSLGLVSRTPVAPTDFIDAAKRAEWRTQRHALVFTMVDPGNPFFAIDLFIEPPLPYEELSEDVVTREIEGQAVTVCGKKDLIRMKRLSGRPKDLADLQALQELDN